MARNSEARAQPPGPARVAVVLCSRDRPDFLRSALEAVRAACSEGDDIVVVDSASRTDATRRVAEAAGVRVVRCEQPGASRARNAGYRETDAPIIAFTDDDCLPQPGWTNRLASAFDEPCVGFVTGRVPGVGDGQPMSVFDSPTPRRLSAGDDVTLMGHGANMAFRRAALDAVGGFDEVLGAGAPLPGAEDADAFWRVLRHGFAGRYEPRAAVAHRCWRGRGQALRLSYRYGVGQGAFVTKVARLGGRAARASVGGGTWRANLRQAGVDLRSGYEFGVVLGLFRIAGLLVGSTRARLTPIRHGHFNR